MVLDLMERKIHPMEPRSSKDIPLGSQFLYQVKWDGVRMLVFIKDGSVMLQNRQLKDRTLQYPETLDLVEQVSFSSGILDGEMVVLREGKPSFPCILKRDLSVNPARIGTLTQTLPAAYFIFDFLYLEGEPLLSLPYEKRQELLKDSVQENQRIKVTDNFEEGEKLFAWVKEKGLEGVVAKDRKSPYVFGKKSRHWWKIKVRNRMLCTIGGFRIREGRISSLLVGAFYGEELFYLGRAGTGLKEEEWKNLWEFLSHRQITHSPFVNAPSRAGNIWVEPSLALWIEFTEWTPELKLRAPSIKGFTTRAPEDCIM